MKKIGRETSFLSVNGTVHRNGEGSFLKLKDGRILYAYSRFTGGFGRDDGAADIGAIYSSDGGKSWSEPEILYKRQDSEGNIMCPNLIRMANGDMGMIFMKKLHTDDSAVVFVRSSDEGKSFSEPQYCTNPKGHYVVLENDRVVRLKNGRIILPLNHHSALAENETKMSNVGTMVCIVSDDDGRSWHQAGRPVHHPHEKFTTHGMQETLVYECENGRLRSLSRSEYGCQYECFSDDMGESWSEVHPNVFFTSPPSPLLLKKTPFCTVAVWNPVPLYTTRDESEPWGRTPLVMAVSEDDGNTFRRIYYLEDDRKNAYCYPSVYAGEDFLLVAYYHSDNREMPLVANKIIRIELKELEIGKNS